ncbi:GtrA family protein [Patescibacteria group bacterium]|nr:GtrA family protein [Patescibacteria group bacterium]MBU1029195.1 GtrA family protein [Patescibacteria group bacterium]MBU1915591.1 GtrA family protein [Patescibacteria group bacterium]
MRILISIFDTVTHRHPTARQLLKFCLVGTINTLVDFTSYVFLTRLFVFWEDRLVLASVLSYCCGMISSFILNNFWTWRRDNHGLLQRLPRFLLVTFIGMAWNAALLYILVGLGMYDIFAKALATVCVIAWNFILQKRWVFRT